MDWVVRAGAAEARSLIRGYQLHRGVPGLYGFSVQHSPGRTVEELAKAGQFPHPLISYATAGSLAAAVQPLGYSMRLIKSPGQGYHHPSPWCTMRAEACCARCRKMRRRR